MINGLTLLGIFFMVILTSWALGRYLEHRELRKVLYCPKHNEPWFGLNGDGDRYCLYHVKHVYSIKWPPDHNCPQPHETD